MIDMFETHIFQNDFPENKIELCRELSSVRADILAKTPEEAKKLFLEFYKKCTKEEHINEL